MNKDTIIIVDTDIEFKSRFEKKIAEESLTDKYEIHLLIPKTTLEISKLIEECLTEVEAVVNSGINICGIFIDIVIVESGPLDTTGIKIAAELRKHFPAIPLFNITAKFGGDEENNMFSEATLEDIDGVLVKKYLEGKTFSAKRLKDIFTKAKIKRSKYTADMNLTAGSTIQNSIKTTSIYYSVTPRVEYQIQQIGKNPFYNLLTKLLPSAEGAISFMQSGRSGAYIFKILAKFKEKGKSPTRPKAWIIKVANETNLLNREVQNYLEIKKTPLNSCFYPQLLANVPSISGNLAGIALELKESADSFMECFDKLSTDEINKITTDISEILTTIYGDPVKKVVNVWGQFYSLNEYGSIKILSFLEEYNGILKEKNDQNHISRISNFIKSKGITEGSITNFQAEVDTRTIHGDFNSRNILVNGDKKIVIIDFSERGQGHIAKDIAKLERDIVFRVFDAFSPRYHDWSRIEIWQHFLDLNKKGNVFSEEKHCNIDDVELKKSITFIRGIRDILRKLSPELDEREYLLALLHFSLLALAHSEISIQKKVFGIKYINQILESLC